MAHTPVDGVPRPAAHINDIPEKQWAPMAAACETVAAERGRIAERIVAAIHREIPSYSASDTPHEDIITEAGRHLVAMLHGIAQRRPPSEEELAIRADVGRRRAEQGVPAEDLLRAFHIGYRELWNALVFEAERDTRAAPLLVRATALAWSWVQVESTVAAEAHKGAIRGQEAAALQRGSRLLDHLLFGEATSPVATDLARSVGLHPDGHFTAIRMQGDGELAREVHRAQKVLQAHPDPSLCVAHGGGLVVLTQPTDPGPVAGDLAEEIPSAAIGVGLRRAGLAGAAISLEDADWAVHRVRATGVCHFADDWFGSCLAQQLERVQPLLAAGLEAASENDHLVEAIRAWIDADFSKARAAENIFVHPHTITYRLERWHALTGWNPATWNGLLHTVAALELQDAEGEVGRATGSNDDGRVVGNGATPPVQGPT